MKKIIKKFVNKYFQFIKFGEKFDVTIIDDVFPYPISPWRNFEYVAISQFFKTRIYSDGVDKNKFVLSNDDFDVLYKEFNLKYPNSLIHGKKLKLFSPLNTELVYLLFYGYLNRYFKHIKKHKCQLIFTLYPGGGFDTQSKLVKNNLREYTSYNRFKGVIVNQNYTKKYLVEKIGVDESKILLVKQIMLIEEYYNVNPLINKKWYNIDKETFDIAFVANKYMDGGADKGFDVFVDFAEKAIELFPFIRFHVVGGFFEDDLRNSELLTYFKFYGFKNFEFFKQFYKSVDLFISPNKPFAIGGNFDGFPLGTAIEAGICGAVVMMTDYLNENEWFVDKKDYFNINLGVNIMLEYLIHLINNPKIMVNFVENFNETLFKNCGNDIGLKKRINFFNKLLNMS